jgi:uncharacterized protein (DUF697 family)
MTDTDTTTIDGTLENVKHRYRITRVNKLVRNHSVLSAAMGLVPMPPVTMGLILANNLKMLHKLSSIYGVKFSEDAGKAAISSFLAGCGTVSISGRLIWGLSTAIPVAAPVIGIVTIPIFGTAATYAVGHLFIQHFESGGTFLNFDPEKVKGYYAELFAEGEKLAEGEKIAKA